MFNMKAHKEPIIISEEKFWQEYKPQINHLEREKSDESIADEDICSFAGTMYETYGEDLDYVAYIKSVTPKKVWTILDCDGVLCLSAGYHHVNRYGYMITEKEWETGN